MSKDREKAPERTPEELAEHFCWDAGDLRVVYRPGEGDDGQAEDGEASAEGRDAPEDGTKGKE
jgi:hypothetical protein